MSVGKAVPLVIGRLNDGKVLLFDGVLSEAFTVDIGVPMHVVEGDGRSVVDHQQPGLLNASVEAVITETPIARTTGVGMTGGERRVLDAIDFLQGCLKGQLYVQFSRNRTQTMLLTSLHWAFPNTRKCLFTMTFRRVDTAQATSVLIAARIKPKAPHPDVGPGVCTPEQTGPQVPLFSETEETQSRSSLYGLALATGYRDPGW